MIQKIFNFFVFALIFLCGKVYSQPLQLLAPGTNPINLIDFNGTLIFQGGSSPSNLQLWKSDGTVAGTRLLKNIKTSFDYEHHPIINNNLFFCGSDGVNGWELWKTNGTPEGTLMVKDINPGAGQSIPSEFTISNGKIFFTASNGVNSYELWKSDGTSSGTVMVKDINPGEGYSAPTDFFDANGVLFFAANDAIHGYELWRSDGTSNGTVMVKDINPGTGSSHPLNMVNKDGVVYFFANDGVNGYKLWRSDGTVDGTVMVNDIKVVDKNSTISYLISINGSLFFSGTDDIHGSELWKSDGTDAGTVLVKDIYAGANSSFPTYFAELKGSLFFDCYDGVHGSELWKSDGTEAGTVLVKDIDVRGNFGSGPQILKNISNTLVFCTGIGMNRNLWKSDGTSEDTKMAYDLYPEKDTSTIYDIIGCGEFVYFVGDNYKLQKTLCRYAKEAQTINVEPFSNKTYGDNDFNISGAASSGLKLAYSSSNVGVAKIQNSNITIEGAGSSTITAYQEGDAFFKPASVQKELVVNKVDLIVTADNQSRKEGETNPIFTVSYSGFVKSETESVIDIKPVASCVATTQSPAGVYDITLISGSDNNYNLTTNNGKLTVTASSTSTSIIENSFKVFPIPTTDNLYLTSDMPITNGTIRLYSLRGELVLTQKINESKICLDLGNFPNGLYVLKISDDNKMIVKQIIKN